MRSTSAAVASGEGAGVDDDGHDLASSPDGRQDPAVPVPDADALVVAGGDESGRGARARGWSDELPEGVGGTDGADVVVGQQRRRVQLHELGGRLAQRLGGGGAVGHGVPPWCA
jgi:hypothetical protein